MRQSLLTVALLVLAWLSWMLRDLVMLVGFAAVFAYALDPVVSWLERLPGPRGRTMPRGLAAGLAIVLLAVVLGTTVAVAVPRLAQQLVRFAKAVPGALTHLDQDLRAFVAAHGLAGPAGGAGGGGAGNATSILGAIEGAAKSLAGSLVGNLGGLASLVLLPLFAFYMLAGAGSARASVLARVPNDRREHGERFLDALDRALRAYVRGQVLVCLAMGTTMGVVLQLLGFPVATLLGVAVGLAEIIPILGFWIAAVAIALEGYSKSPGFAVAGVVSYMVVNNLMSTFVSPRLLGRQVKLHPFVINVAVIGGGMLLGPGGAILALPVAAIAKSLLDEFGPKRCGAGEPASGVTQTSS